MTEKYLISFESTHNAIAVGEALKSCGAIMIPTPREITASCGISVIIKAEYIKKVADVFENVGMDIYDYTIYSVNDGQARKYTFIKGKNYG